MNDGYVKLMILFLAIFITVFGCVLIIGSNNEVNQEHGPADLGTKIDMFNRQDTIHVMQVDTTTAEIK